MLQTTAIVSVLLVTGATSVNQNALEVPTTLVMAMVLVTQSQVTAPVKLELNKMASATHAKTNELVPIVPSL